MAFNKDKIKNDLKKAIYKAIAKAYKQNIPFVKQAVDGISKEHAVNHIIADLEDENMVAEVPENHIPVDKDNVLHKDVPSVKELHDAKQLQAKAKLGVMPAAGQKGAVYMSEGPSKGVQKLKKFMGERELKMEKARIDQKMPAEEKQQARWDRAGDPVKGVHTAPFKSAPGLSTAGYEIESTGKPTGVARASHEKVISEQKAMPKPNLPKSEEMSKARIDDGKTIKEKQEARESRHWRTPHWVGSDPKAKIPSEILHENYTNKEGQLRGMKRRHDGNPKWDPANSASNEKIGLSIADTEKGVHHRGEYLEGAKSTHKKKLAELKAMPKPNLPKSEGMYKDDMPHIAGSPEDSAHDVVEEHASLQEKIADLTPEERAEMLAHLRTLKDRRNLRSAKNQAVGMNKSLKSGKWKR